MSTLPPFFLANRLSWALLCLAALVLMSGCPPDFSDDECAVDEDCFTDEVCQANFCVIAQVFDPQVSSFESDLAQAQAGQSVELSWTMVDVERATITDAQGALVYQVPDTDLAQGSTSVTVAQTTTYTLIAFNGERSDEAVVTVTVEVLAPPVIASFTAR